MRFDIFKVLILGVWGLVVANEIVGFPMPWSRLFRLTLGVMVVAHIAEYFVFNRVIRARPESPAVQAVMTALFGVFYWKDFPYSLRDAPKDDAS